MKTMLAQKGSHFSWFGLLVINLGYLTLLRLALSDIGIPIKSGFLEQIMIELRLNMKDFTSVPVYDIPGFGNRRLFNH